MPLNLPINWSDAALLGPPFLRFLWDFLKGCPWGSFLACYLVDRFPSYLLSLLLYFIAFEWNGYTNLFCLSEGLWSQKELDRESRGGFPLYVLSFEQTRKLCNRFSCNYGVIVRFNFAFWIFQVCCIVPSDSLDISQPRQLIYVVCVQSFIQKDGEAFRRISQLILRSIFRVIPLWIESSTSWWVLCRV